jgi:hypothetical protein
VESADSELSQVEQRRSGAFIEERSLIIACFGAQHASVFEACGARALAGSSFSRLLLRPGFASQDGALPVGRAAAGGACRNVDGLRELCQVTNDQLRRSRRHCCACGRVPNSSRREQREQLV